MNITSENFEKEVLQSEIPVLVDFWANWCMPCKMMTPVVEDLEKEMKDTVKVCKINIDEEANLAIQYGVMSIPTFLVFKNGKVINKTVGMQEKQELLKLLQ